jgi:hypothetical protein
LFNKENEKSYKNNSVLYMVSNSSQRKEYSFGYQFSETTIVDCFG